MKKLSKSTLLASVASIAILLIGIVLLILQYAIPFKFFLHPVGNMFLVFAVGFGIICLAYGIMRKSPVFMCMLALLVLYIAIYVFVSIKTEWWFIGLIVGAVLGLVIAVTSFLFVGGKTKTEQIAMNDSPEYKTYEERKAEKAEQEAKEAENAEPLPELKSFKDDNDKQ